MTSADNLKLLKAKTEAQLRDLAGRSSGVTGLAVLDLTNGEQFGVNENCLFPQASAIKIPVLMEVYKQAARGTFKLTDTRRIEKQDKTTGSGVLAFLGDGTVQMNLHDLCVLMIVLSDNTATNILIDLVGMAAVNETLDSLGLAANAPATPHDGHTRRVARRRKLFHSRRGGPHHGNSLARRFHRPLRLR